MTAPALAQGQAEPLKMPDAQLEPIEFSDLDHWADDDHRAAFETFLTSCKPFLATRRPQDPRPLYGALWHVCRRAAAAKPKTEEQARRFFEENFRPVRIAKLGEETGLLTGYYEPVVDGSRFPSPEFHVPLYRRPPELLADGKKPPPGKFPNKGVTVGRRNDKNAIEPYYDRAAIEAGALDGRHLEICWVRDPFDVLAIQIQGSARIRLEDGTMLRINYDGHNGYPYTAVGRVLIERGFVRREEMSMDRIRRWMAEHPREAPEVRGTNRSYVFFRITGLSDDNEPAGAQGVPLTPGRSIAVDKLHIYGTPFFIEAELPIARDQPDTKLRRLMVAQDTGSAIVGPARADLYWGSGDRAGQIAGRFRQQGRFVMMLPRELDMVEAGRHMPLPEPKPSIPDEKTKQKPEAKPALTKEAKGEVKIEPPKPSANEQTRPQAAQHQEAQRPERKRHRRSRPRPQRWWW